MAHMGLSPFKGPCLGHAAKEGPLEEKATTGRAAIIESLLKGLNMDISKPLKRIGIPLKRPLNRTGQWIERHFF